MTTFFIYLVVLFYITLFAWNYGASLGPVGPGGRNYNLNAFRSIYRIAVYSKDIMDPVRILVGNILLFVPFGFLGIQIIKKFHYSLGKITVLGMFVSIFIETYQFLFTYRVANIDDVILNTLGTFIGASIFVIHLKLKKVVFYFQS